MSTRRIGGLRGYLSRNLRGRKGQQGFTLIELLVVVTILGVLAAIVTLSLVGLTTNASVQSCKQEYKTVQAALDAFMANNNVDIITGYGDKVVGVNDMQLPLLPVGLSLYNPSPTSASPNYTRNGSTQFYYSWDVNGHIFAIFSSGSGAAAPNGCKIT